MRTRPRHVSVWMNEAEYRHLKMQAELAGMGIDPFVRSLVAGVQLRPRPQIAYWANARKSIHEAEIVDAVQLVRKAWELVKNGL